MNIVSIVLSSGSGLFLFSTLLCGFWLRSQGATPEGVSFHNKLAVGTAIVLSVTVVTLLVFVLRAR